MLTKILFTSLVILAVLAYFRYANSSPEPKRPATKKSKPDNNSVKSGNFRFVAYAFIVLMLISSTAMVYHRWQQGQTLVTVRVINTRTGTTTNYQAKRVDIERHTFITAEGKKVIVADVERIEFIE